MKKYSLPILIAGSILLTSGCSALDFPEKPLVDPTDIQICDRTGDDITGTIRVLKPENYTKEKALESLALTKANYTAELHKSRNKDIENMLNLMVKSNEEITIQVQQDRPLSEIRESWKSSARTWIYICTSLSEEM
jgi:hypothetical protein